MGFNENYQKRCQLLMQADLSTAGRRKMASAGVAMKDGSYPIPNVAYLKKAIRAVGRGTKNSKSAIKAHIKKRAKALGATNLIPDTWKGGAAAQGAFNPPYGQPSNSVTEVGQKTPEQGSKAASPTVKPQTSLTKRAGKVKQSTAAAMILQADEEKRFILCVLQSPEGVTHPTTHPEYELSYPIETIEAMAWGFLQEKLNDNIGLHHQEVSDSGIVAQNGQNAVLVESSIVRSSFTMQDPVGEMRVVAQGSWLGGFVLSPKAWQLMKQGDISAPSIVLDEYEFAEPV